MTPGDLVLILKDTPQPDGYRLAPSISLVGRIGTLAEMFQWKHSTKIYRWVTFSEPFETLVDTDKTTTSQDTDWLFLEEDIELVFTV